MILFVLTVIYLYLFTKMIRMMSEAVKNKKEMDLFYLKKDVLLNVMFSSKADKLLSIVDIISFLLLGALWIYQIAGSREIADLLDIKRKTCEFLYIITVWVFIIVGTVTIYYARISAGVGGQSLYIKNDRIIGNICAVEKFTMDYEKVEILIKDIKEVIFINNERMYGLNLSKLIIITEDERYEYTMPVDGEATKRLIESKIK